MKAFYFLLEVIIAVICGFLIAFIVVPLHLLFAPLARRKAKKERSQNG
ncbi:MAG: hypothetical protein RM021_017425 [Nostoc sp. EkiNYC01]|nr:hypothetical protein [Nostoc sp. EkiNYC01]